MQTDLFQLLLVLAGGVIGVSGGLLTSLVSNALATKKARRDDLLAAYVEWSRVIYHAIYEAEQLWLYDAFEDLRKKHLQELNTVESSPSGRTRQEHVHDHLTATDNLRAAEARLLLLERRPKMREKVSELSSLTTPRSAITVSAHDVLSAMIEYVNIKRTGIRHLLEEIAGSRSGF